MNLKSMPYFTAKLRTTCAVVYRYLIQKEAPLRNDSEDVVMLTAVTEMDGYVSAEKGARDFCKLIFPEKKVVALDEFLAMVQLLSSSN